MKFTGKERRLYLLALMLLAAAIALACTWTLWEGSTDQTSLPAQTPSAAPSPTPAGSAATLLETSPSASPEADTTSTSAQTVNTVVYYQDDYGYLVPVMCTVPAEPGHCQGHACDDGQVDRQRHAGRAPGAAHGAAREHVH